MKFDLTKPCSDCPLRKDKPFYLRAGRREEIVQSVMAYDAPFACHKTLSLPFTQKQFCAGMLIVLEKMGETYGNLYLRLAVNYGLYIPTDLDMNAPVYETLQQWIDNQERDNAWFESAV